MKRGSLTLLALAALCAPIKIEAKLLEPEVKPEEGFVRLKGTTELPSKYKFSGFLDFYGGKGNEFYAEANVRRDLISGAYGDVHGKLDFETGTTFEDFVRFGLAYTVPHQFDRLSGSLSLFPFKTTTDGNTVRQLQIGESTSIKLPLEVYAENWWVLNFDYRSIDFSMQVEVRVCRRLMDKVNVETQFGYDSGVPGFVPRFGVSWKF